MKQNLKNPENKRTTKIFQDEAEMDSLMVGIIGCGRLGSQIAHCLLTYGRLHPSKLHISTRRPETLGEFSFYHSMVNWNFGKFIFICEFIDCL